MEHIPGQGPDSTDLGADLVPLAVGTLNMREEVIDGFLQVREKHNQLQALLHQVMRRVALPRCQEIGEILLRVRRYYPKGSKGPSGMPSKFFADAKAVTGLGKSSLHNYITIAQNWGRLVDYLADLPEGATPVTSLRSALEVIREMNRPLPAAGGDDRAIDTEAEVIGSGDEVVDTQAAARRAAAAGYVREPAKLGQQLRALRAVRGLPVELRDRLETFARELDSLLAAVEAALSESLEITPEPAKTDLRPPARAFAAVERVTHELVDDSAPGGPSMTVVKDAWVVDLATSDERLVEVGSLSEDLLDRVTRTPLAAKYPKTAEGLKALRLDIAAASSGAELGRQLGVSRAAVSAYLKSLTKAVEG